MRPTDVTYRGSDGQRHYARILAWHDDGSCTIRRGYYDPFEGTRTRWHPADEVRDYRTGKPVTLAPMA